MSNGPPPRGRLPAGRLPRWIDSSKAPPSLSVQLIARSAATNGTSVTSVGAAAGRNPLVCSSAAGVDETTLAPPHVLL